MRKKILQDLIEARIINEKESVELLSLAPIFDEKRLLCAEYDDKMDSMTWQDKLPFLQFKPDWLVRIVPPFVGAVIRFKVRKNTTPGHQNVSIYFDAFNHLGSMRNPYWEVYPAADGDTARFHLGEESEMMEEIEASLRRLEDPENEKFRVDR